MHCQRACSDSVHNGTMICSACAGSIHYKDFILCLMMWKMHDWQPVRQRPNNSWLNTPQPNPNRNEITIVYALSALLAHAQALIYH